jgi:hypothetical protein
VSTFLQVLETSPCRGGAAEIFNFSLQLGFFSCYSRAISFYSAALTTGKPTFAVRQNLCRAFYIGRTAKSFFAVRFFIGRTAKKKRTTNKLFAVRRNKTHGKDLVCRAFFSRRTAKFFPLFPCASK